MKLKNGYDVQGSTNRADFKSQSPLVLTYCVACKYSRPINREKAPEKYFKDNCVVCECEDVVGDEPMVYPPLHFCSYGEQKND